MQNKAIAEPPGLLMLLKNAEVQAYFTLVFFPKI